MGPNTMEPAKSTQIYYEVQKASKVV